MQGGDGSSHYQVQARLALLDKDFKLAEMYYLEQVCAPSDLSLLPKTHPCTQAAFLESLELF